jgi:DNA primase
LAGRASSRDLAASVRSAGDIVELVSDYVLLKRAGSRYKGLCPFHQEKTPSFTVDPQAQLFYCFGCQQGGDLFRFVMLYEKVGFREALEMLARRFGVSLPDRSRGEPGLRERILEANRLAEAYYRKQLHDPEAGRRARAYLAERGLSRETIEALGLGYAPDRWEALRGHLLSKGFEPSELVAAGLVLAREDGRGGYDRFRDRLVFPIRDAGGRTVGFGGRSLGDGEPKYLNSPETEAYRKGEHLYGFDRARGAIRREGYAVLVEGYFDLAALIQAGFEHAVATLGTALTPEQVRLLGRVTEKVVLSYDGDAAGSAATVRAVDLLLERGFEVRAAVLPAGQDPDDFLRSAGPDSYRELLARAPGWLDFLLEREARGCASRSVGEKIAAINALLPRIAKLRSAVERAEWVRRIASAFAVEDDAIVEELKAAARSARPSIRPRAVRPAESVREAEARLVPLLVSDPEARGRATASLEEADLEGSPVARIVRTILRLHGEGKPVSYLAVFDELEREEDRDLLARLVFREGQPAGAEEVGSLVEVLRRRRLQREGRLLQQAIERASGALLDQLLAEKIRVARERDALS